MAIVAGDILFKFSIKAGSAGGASGGTAAGSLGRYVSTTQLTDATLNNLFDDVASAEAAAGDDEYRCIFVHNSHGSLTLENAKVWIVSEQVAGRMSIAVDDTAASAYTASPVQAREVTDESTAPGVITFSSPTTEGGGLSLGNIGPGQVKAIWIKRHVVASSGAVNDSVVLRVKGDTAA